MVSLPAGISLYLCAMGEHQALGQVSKEIQETAALLGNVSASEHAGGKAKAETMLQC